MERETSSATVLSGVSLNASCSCSVTQQLGSPQLIFIKRNLHLPLDLGLAKLAKLSYAKASHMYVPARFIKNSILLFNVQ
jgi:hypothetical protein